MGMHDDGILGGRKYVPPKMSDIIRGDWQEARGDRTIRIQEVDDCLELEEQPASGAAMVLSRNHSTAAVLISWTAYARGRSGARGEAVYDVALEGENRVTLRRGDGEAVQFVRLQEGQRLFSPSRSARRARPESKRRARRCARSSSSSDRRRHKGDEEHQRLVQKVKSLQSSARELNERWQSYCEQYGRGIFDPNRHDVHTLQGYLDFVSKDPERSRSRDGLAGGRRHRARDAARQRRRTSHRARRRGRRKRRTARRDKVSRSGATNPSSGVRSSSSSSSGRQVDAQPERAESESPEAAAESLEIRVARTAKESAEADKAEAERALAEERVALETNLQYRVAVERDRQAQNAADMVAAAEAEARAEEEGRLKEAVRSAREAREAKVLAAQKDAEEAVEEAVQHFEKAGQEEVRSKLAPFESRLADATETASKAATAYEDLLQVPALKKRSRSLDVDQNMVLAAKAAAAAFNSKQAGGKRDASQRGRRRKKRRCVESSTGSGDG
ncbi:unnamed protein product [Symbiodinium sp. CCMP2592]|nr:unnamed protein product [Symbiodinium sp. CCMP2592]